jgi:hypothetical protein
VFVSIATAEKIVSPPQVAPSLAPSQPPSPGAREPSSPQKPQSNAGQQAPGSDQRGADQVPPTVKVLPTPKSQTEIDDEQRRADEHAANERGLTTATWALAGFTMLLAMVALGQIGLFLWQLRLIRESLDDAKIAAEAAREGARAARDSADTAKLSMIAGDRAYVHQDGFRWISHLVPSTNKYFWRLHPRWVNSGNTPTRALNVYIKYELLDTELPDDYSFSVDPNVTAALTGISPKGIIESAYYDISGDDLRAVMDRTKYLYVWGIARYRDVFPNTEEHITKFCSFARDITGNPLIAYDDRTNPLYIVFGIYRRHNCADDDCNRHASD